MGNVCSCCCKGASKVQPEEDVISMRDEAVSTSFNVSGSLIGMDQDNDDDMDNDKNKDNECIPQLSDESDFPDIPEIPGYFVEEVEVNVRKTVFVKSPKYWAVRVEHYRGVVTKMERLSDDCALLSLEDLEDQPPSEVTEAPLENVNNIASRGGEEDNVSQSSSEVEVIPKSTEDKSLMSTVGVILVKDKAETLDEEVSEKSKMVPIILYVKDVPVMDSEESCEEEMEEEDHPSAPEANAAQDYNTDISSESDSTLSGDGGEADVSSSASEVEMVSASSLDELALECSDDEI